MKNELYMSFSLRAFPFVFILFNKVKARFLTSIKENIYIVISSCFKCGKTDLALKNLYLSVRK